MFNMNDKMTFTANCFDEDNRQLPFMIKFPIEKKELKEFFIPENVDYIQLIEYSNDLNSTRSFYIYTGHQFTGNDLMYNKEYSRYFRGPSKNCIDDEEKRTRKFYDTRLCCTIDPITKIILIRAFLSNDDIVVDKKDLKDIIIEISNQYSKIRESVDAIKSLKKTYRK